MTEDQTRDLIKKSVVKTSDTFVDELMHTVALQKNSAKKIRFNFFLACAACIVLYLLIANVPSNIHLLNIRFHVPPVLIKVISSIVILTVVNQLILLKKKLLSAEHNFSFGQ
jgi:hypothetical protein